MSRLKEILSVIAIIASIWEPLVKAAPLIKPLADWVLANPLSFAEKSKTYVNRYYRVKISNQRYIGEEFHSKNSPPEIIYMLRSSDSCYHNGAFRYCVIEQTDDYLVVQVTKPNGKSYIERLTRITN